MIVPIRISNALLVTINWAIVTLMTLRLSTLHPLHPDCTQHCTFGPNFIIIIIV